MKLIPVMLLASSCVAMAACSKDTFETKPKIEITGYNTRELRTDQILSITMDYFDKEGDLGNGSVTAILDRQNISDANIPRAMELAYVLPEFPPRDKGEIVLRIPYESLEHTDFENDTFLLRVFVIDRASNISDTVTTEQIVSVRP